MPSVTINIDEEVKKIISRRAKNLLTLKEQAEEILRQSTIRTKTGTISQLEAGDDLLKLFQGRRRESDRKRRRNN